MIVRLSPFVLSSFRMKNEASRCCGWRGDGEPESAEKRREAFHYDEANRILLIVTFRNDGLALCIFYN